MVVSTCFQHTSSHPDKYNNSVDRIISKEEEREDPRRDTSVFFEYSGVSTYNPFYKELHAIQHSYKNSKCLHTNCSLLQLFYIQNQFYHKKYYNYKAHPMQIITRHLPVTVPRTSKHSTRQNKAPGYPTAFQAHTAEAGFQLILPSRNSTPSGSQHPRSPYSSSQAHSYRILPGEIGFISEGLSIVCPCNTKVSVFQVTYSCA